MADINYNNFLYINVNGSHENEIRDINRIDGRGQNPVDGNYYYFFYTTDPQNDPSSYHLIDTLIRGSWIPGDEHGAYPLTGDDQSATWVNTGVLYMRAYDNPDMSGQPTLTGMTYTNESDATPFKGSGDESYNAYTMELENVVRKFYVKAKEEGQTGYMTDFECASQVGCGAEIESIERDGDGTKKVLFVTHGSGIPYVFVWAEGYVEEHKTCNASSGAFIIQNDFTLSKQIMYHLVSVVDNNGNKLTNATVVDNDGITYGYSAGGAHEWMGSNNVAVGNIFDAGFLYSGTTNVTRSITVTYNGETKTGVSTATISNGGHYDSKRHITPTLTIVFGGDEPTPPTPVEEKIYRINVKRSDTHAMIGNENIWVGNTPNDGFSKQTSGQTMGETYSYVEFTWNELLKAIGEEPEECTPELRLYTPDDIEGGIIPKDGGTWILTAETTCDVAITGFRLISGSPYTTIRNNGNGTVTMTVSANTNKESGRDIEISVQTSNSELYDSWLFSQSKADWEISDADYLQFTYGWTIDNGLDLDTFTFVKFAGDADVYGDDRYKGVGFAAIDKVPTASTTYNDSVIAWAGDNQGTGGEYTLINFRKFHEEFRRDADVYVMGNWYRTMVDGKCNIVLSGYRGGTVNNNASSTTGFTIDGGEKVQGDASVENICYARARGNVANNLSGYTTNYCLLCVMHYDYSENKVYLYANGPEFEESEYYCLGYYTAWVIRSEIIDEITGTDIKDLDQRFITASSATHTHSFTGATVVSIDVGVNDLLYGNHEKETHHTTNYSITNVDKRMWPTSDTSYQILSETLTEKRYQAEISFSNDGVYDMGGGKKRELRFEFSIWSSDASGRVDTFYLELDQYKQEQETTSLSARAISFYDDGFETSNETGRFLVIAKTGNGQELSDLSLTSTAITQESTFDVSPPVYLGNGTYISDVYKFKGYTGSDAYEGFFKVGLTFSSSGLENDVTLQSTATPDVDHSAIIRYNGGSNVKESFCPSSGTTFEDEVLGMAYDAMRISGNNIFYYDETSNEISETYYVTPEVEFPANADASTMFSTNLSIDYGVSTLSTTIKPNTSASPKVGKVVVKHGTSKSASRVTRIFIQDGTEQKFGCYMSMPYTGNSRTTCMLSNGTQDNQYMFLIDISQHGKIYTLNYTKGSNTNRSIVFHKGISSYIKVEDSENVISPTISRDGRYEEYKSSLSVGTGSITFKITIL